MTDSSDDIPSRFRVEAAANADLPAEIRALGAILTVDFLLGLWLTLHAETALAAYLAPQVPAIGLAALAWGFLPAAPKAAFGSWLSRRLANRSVFWSAIVAGSIGLVASAVVSTVIVESVDPGVATSVRVVRGTSERVDSADWAASAELRLNRLTTPQTRHLLISPLGSRVWVHTDRFVSTDDPRLLPWVPTRLQYPDDFVRMVTVEVLPDDTTLTKLAVDRIVLELSADDGSGEVIARVLLKEGSTRVAFIEPPPLDRSTLDGWRALLAEISSDPDFVDPMIGTWTNTEWARASRPLRVDETIRYAVLGPSDERLDGGVLSLNDAVTRLSLAF